MVLTISALVPTPDSVGLERLVQGSERERGILAVIPAEFLNAGERVRS